MKDYMASVSVEEAINAGHTDTLCWDCKNAMRGGCSWCNPDIQKPVKGWKATPTDVGFVVHTCPEFVRDGYGCGRYRTADDYILALETAMTQRKMQIARLKKIPDKIRAKNAKLTKALDKEMWWAVVHNSD